MPGLILSQLSPQEWSAVGNGLKSTELRRSNRVVCSVYFHHPLSLDRQLST